MTYKYIVGAIAGFEIEISANTLGEAVAWAEAHVGIDYHPEHLKRVQFHVTSARQLGSSSDPGPATPPADPPARLDSVSAAALPPSQPDLPVQLLPSQPPLPPDPERAELIGRINGLIAKFNVRHEIMVYLQRIRLNGRVITDPDAPLSGLIEILDELRRIEHTGAD